MTVIAVDQIGTLGIAIAVLFLGAFLTLRIAFLKQNFIPAAVTGGLLALPQFSAATRAAGCAHEG